MMTLGTAVTCCGRLLGLIYVHVGSPCRPFLVVDVYASGIRCFMTFEEARRSSLKASLVIGQVQKVTVARDENFAINPGWSCCIFLVVGIISGLLKADLNVCLKYSFHTMTWANVTSSLALASMLLKSSRLVDVMSATHLLLDADFGPVRRWWPSIVLNTQLEIASLMRLFLGSWYVMFWLSAVFQLMVNVVPAFV